MYLKYEYLSDYETKTKNVQVINQELLRASWQKKKKKLSRTCTLTYGLMINTTVDFRQFSLYKTLNWSYVAEMMVKSN